MQMRYFFEIEGEDEATLSSYAPALYVESSNGKKIGFMLISHEFMQKVVKHYFVNQKVFTFGKSSREEAPDWLCNKHLHLLAGEMLMERFAMGGNIWKAEDGFEVCRLCDNILEHLTLKCRFPFCSPSWNF